MAYDSRNKKIYLICFNQKHKKNSFFWLGKHITVTLSITDNVGVTKTEGEMPQMVACLLLCGNNGMQFYPIDHDKHDKVVHIWRSTLLKP